MTIREAFEQGLTRGHYLSELKNTGVLSDDEREAIEKEIKFIEQVINEYRVVCGGTVKEFDGLIKRKYMDIAGS